ncbi:MAG: hypothetical protein ABI391_07660 [Hyphomicrobiaceae bacterium]
MQRFDTASAVVWVEGVNQLEALQRLSFIPPRSVDAKGASDTPGLALEYVLAEQRRRLELLEQCLADPFVPGEATTPPTILPGDELEAVAPNAATDGGTLLGRDKPQETD